MDYGDTAFIILMVYLFLALLTAFWFMPCFTSGLILGILVGALKWVR